MAVLEDDGGVPALVLPVTTTQRFELGAMRAARIAAVVAGCIAVPLVALTGRVGPALIAFAWCIVSLGLFFGSGVGALVTLDRHGMEIQGINDGVFFCPAANVKRIVAWRQSSHFADFGSVVLVCRSRCAKRLIWFISVSRISAVEEALAAIEEYDFRER